MNRPTLTTMVLFGLAVAAFPQAGFAQGDPFIGTWQINLAKAKYNPGPPPKSLTVNIQGDGQNRKVATVGIGSEGNPFASVTELAEDGKPHPVIGSLIVDAEAWTRVDARTVNIGRTKAGKLYQTITFVVSPDGKTLHRTRLPFRQPRISMS
jgi:hypothetical protein